VRSRRRTVLLDGRGRPLRDSLASHREGR